MLYLISLTRASFLARTQHSQSAPLSYTYAAEIQGTDTCAVKHTKTHTDARTHNPLSQVMGPRGQVRANMITDPQGCNNSTLRDHLSTFAEF